MGVIALLSANLLTAEIFVKESAVSIPTNVFSSKKHIEATPDSEAEEDLPSSDGWGSVFFGNELTVGNKFDNGFDVYASVQTGMDGFFSKDSGAFTFRNSAGEDITVSTHSKFRQTFLDNTFGVGYTIYGLRVGVNLFHAMDLGGPLSTGSIVSSRLYVSPQLHYGYSLESVAGIPLTLGLGAEWDFGIGLSNLLGGLGGGRFGGGAFGRIVSEDKVYTPESNPQFWLDASYAVSEKLSFDLSAGLDINEPVKITRIINNNTVPRGNTAWDPNLVEEHEYEHTSLSFPVKLGVTFR
jgi:hypothetical protein